MARNLLVLGLCLCAILGVSFAATLPEDVADDSKYYCGYCCGYDIYCNRIRNPFILQDQFAKEAPGNLAKLDGQDESQARYYCFTCCGYHWYCN